MDKKTSEILRELDPLKAEFDNKVVESYNFRFVFKRKETGLRAGIVEITELRTKVSYETNFTVDIKESVEYVGINLLSQDLTAKLRAGILRKPKNELIALLEHI